MGNVARPTHARTIAQAPSAGRHVHFPLHERKCRTLCSTPFSPLRRRLLATSVVARVSALLPTVHIRPPAAREVPAVASRAINSIGPATALRARRRRRRAPAPGVSRPAAARFARDFESSCVAPKRRYVAIQSVRIVRI
ncbi:hypothetical protein FU139_18900 [Burkholderia territorii]|nr:hypothetical protein FU139_18900 [Burkholderia territorii]